MPPAELVTKNGSTAPPMAKVRVISLLSSILPFEPPNTRASGAPATCDRHDSAGCRWRLSSTLINGNSLGDHHVNAARVAASPAATPGL